MQMLGTSGAFLISAICSFVAVTVVSRIPYDQPGVWRFPLQRAPINLWDTVSFARAKKIHAVLLGIKIVTNHFG